MSANQGILSPTQQSLSRQKISKKIFSFKKKGFLNLVLSRDPRIWRSRINRIGSKASKAVGKQSDEDIKINWAEENLRHYDGPVNSQIEERSMDSANQMTPVHEDVKLSTEFVEPLVEHNSSTLNIEVIQDPDLNRLDTLMSAKNEAKEEEEELPKTLTPEERIKKILEQRKLKNISRDAFVRVTDSNAYNLPEIDIKSSHEDFSFFLTNKDDHETDWKNMCTPVIEEMHRSQKPKRPHTCPQVCPCKFTQELIEIYHKAKEVSEKSDTVSKATRQSKFRMTKSEIKFFKEDTRMCSVMIGETKSRRAEMRELMDMWQEANEKIALRKKDIFSIADNLQSVTKKLNNVEDFLNNWRTNKKMEQPRTGEFSEEKEQEDLIETFEEEERILAKHKIEKILSKREDWFAQERSRIEERRNKKNLDTLRLKNTIDVMQRYIDERKSLLND